MFFSFLTLIGFHFLILCNPSEDLSTGKFSLAGSFLQICPAEGICPNYCWLHHLFGACEMGWEESSQTQWNSNTEASSFRAIIQRQITKVWEVIEKQLLQRSCMDVIQKKQIEKNLLSEIERIRTSAILMAWNLKSWNMLRLLWCPPKMRSLQIKTHQNRRQDSQSIATLEGHIFHSYLSLLYEWAEQVKGGRLVFAEGWQG